MGGKLLDFGYHTETAEASNFCMCKNYPLFWFVCARSVCASVLFWLVRLSIYMLLHKREMGLCASSLLPISIHSTRRRSLGRVRSDTAYHFYAGAQT